MQKSESESCSVMFNCLWLHWNSPGQNTGLGSLSLLQRTSQPRDQTQVSHIAGGFFTKSAIRKAPSCRRVYSNGDLLRKPFNTEMEAEIPDQNGSWGYRALWNSPQKIILRHILLLCSNTTTIKCLNDGTKKVAILITGTSKLQSEFLVDRKSAMRDLKYA